MAKQAETLSAYRSRRALVSVRPQSLSTETARRSSRKISSAIGDAIRAFRSNCRHDRKRGSQHRVSSAFCFWTGSEHCIRSDEHYETFTSSLGAHIAQTDRQTSTVGTEFMDAALNTVIVCTQGNSRSGGMAAPAKIAFMEMRRLRTHKALYSSGTPRGRRRLPEM